ncbi:cation-translocating P-type ATPase [Caldicellulosiruptor naganoensis]|uniref:HAD-IC family P-type ATPase n=1 Tax=Caldicellulosiruptor naganoensis TaxID=29324 RepID=A0ABY7BK97_9FIRM|nr:HAD-IC family P-type ATPase [Caldicellulosiruptor naganoensis]WAM32501.1 HAD-IC family P-type ATPase [Caldicellulosiruptor naganoensis]
MITKLLEFHERGLLSEKAKKNIERFGLNEIKVEKRKSTFSIFLDQFKGILVVILALSTAMSFLLGEFLNAGVIFSLIILNGILGFVQEFRAEKAIESLKNYISYKAKVVRDGNIEEIETKFVTVNDIVIIEEGDKIPADGILLRSFSLAVNESILTGESLPVEKDEKNENRLYMGTYVIKGKGIMKGTSIGLETKMGKIAKAQAEIEEYKTPLQKKLSQLGKQLALVCLSICAVIVVLGILRKQNIYDMFMVGISLAVAAIPEGLPAVVTITLAVGVQRMARKNALIRKLSAVETLGCVNIICSDKTGTLTENKITVKRIETIDMSIEVEGTGYDLKGRILLNGRIVKNQVLDYLVMCAINCNNAEFSNYKDKQYKVSGDPTEIALLVLAKKYRETLNKGERRLEIPFDSQRKYMGVFVKYENAKILFVKGAFEKLIEKRRFYMCEDGTIRQLGYNEKRVITKKNELLCMSSMRVLLLCMKFESSTVDNMILLGLVGMIDPPKKGVKLAIEKAKKAGVKTIMITGDHKLTAFSIAKDLSIVSSFDEVVDGEELEKDEKILEKKIDKITVFARVDPLHKLKIVRLLKKKGNIVAMTGDGVNDAPAVKEADIGIAMGLSGSDVTREAASMILLDDNYTTIVHAIEEGRLIYSNIRKFIKIPPCLQHWRGSDNAFYLHF